MKLAAPLLLLTSLLSGCAALPPPLDDVPDSAMAQALEVSRAAPAEQASRLQEAQQRFLRQPDSANRLRLATLLATLPVPLRDDARALELLQPIAEPAGGRNARYAAFLSTQVALRQRLAREAERLTREVERLARDREKLERDHAAADKDRDKREEEMRQQIEALRSIERGILEREERMRRRVK